MSSRSARQRALRNNPRANTQVIVAKDNDDGFKKAVGAFAKTFLTGNAAQMALSRGGGGMSSWSNLGGFSSSLIAQASQSLMSSFNKVPADLEAALAEQGLSWGPPFPPGRPLDPFWGYRRAPRTRDFQVGENVQLTPRWNRISFNTIKSLWEAYDVAQICTRHLINDVRSLDYHWEPLPGVTDDVSEDIRKAREFFESPDKRQPFRAWLAEYLMDVIRYDAGCLYIRRNVGGDPIALEVVNGTTMIPLIDYYGRIATDEDDEDPNLTAAGTFHGQVTPGYLQIIMGLPWDWLAADDIIYQPINPLPESQYGLAPLEAVLLTANTDIRFQWHFLNFFTQGNIPTGFMEAPPDLANPQQVQDFQDHWDALMIGDQDRLRQIRWVPAGAKYQPVGAAAEKWDDSFPLYLMRRTCAAHGVTPNDLGFTEEVNKATAFVQVEVQWRVGTKPYIRHAEDVVTFFCTEHLKLRIRMRFNAEREASDLLQRAQAEKIYIEGGVLSPDEPRTRLGYPIDINRPIPRFVNNQRGGPIPLIALTSMAGDIDMNTYAPSRSQDFVDHPFTPLPGVMPVIGTQEHTQAQQASSMLQANLLAETDKRPLPYPVDSTIVPLAPPPKAKLIEEETVAGNKPAGGGGSVDKEAFDSAINIIGHLLEVIAEKDQMAAMPDNTGGPGVNVATGIQGVDLDHGDDEDAEGTSVKAELDLTLRRWRENARNRLRKGGKPRKFEDELLPVAIREAVWSRLSKATTRAEIDAAFTEGITGGITKLASVRESSTLGDHVAHVVGVGAEKQMRRVDAVANVTTMKDDQPIGDRAVEEFPGPAMSKATGLGTIPEKTIPTFIVPGSTTQVFPTVDPETHLGPETIPSHRVDSSFGAKHGGHVLTGDGVGSSRKYSAGHTANYSLRKGGDAQRVDVAGIAVLARDSGRCLLLQRDNDDLKEASGRWEWPAGHLEVDEDPWEGARREWEEEVGQKLPAGEIANIWNDGDYRLYIYAIKRENLITINPSLDELEVKDPDHPTQKHPEVAAWFYPKDAKHGGRVMRPDFEDREFDWSLITDVVDKDEREE